MDGTPTQAGASSSPRGRRWVSHSRHPEIGRAHRSVVRESEIVSSGSRIIELDGSEGEGGGQILRSALSLSMICGKPFRLTKIRAKRKKPGLRPQHLAAVEAAALLCDAEVSGGTIGSCELVFRPQSVSARDFTHKIGTAGSTALVLQTLHLPLAMSAKEPVRVEIHGGTFNTKAPSFPFLDTCWQPLMRSLGLPISLRMASAGFFPQGGGKIEAWIEPATPLPLIKTERGCLVKIEGVAGICGLPQTIADRLRNQALALLADHGLKAEIEFKQWSGTSPGAVISLTSHYQCGSLGTFVGLGERGKPAETVAAEAVDELLRFEQSGGAVDSYSADQILLPLAFARRSSVFTVGEVTEHLRTNARTITRFLNREIRVIEPVDSAPGRVVLS